MQTHIRQYYGNANQEYVEFLKSEYDNISSAHYTTVAAISTFFKHYLLLMSLPIPVGLALLKLSDLDNLPFGPEYIYLSAGVISVILSLVGFFVMCYLSNLRFDAILYAQAVNSIRGFFSDRSNL
ncbi:hypothetical protein KAR91_23440, partial [Candidatus Pacearchaeota archaeon]|nr:hypothetical protein [Candidatus Pacearchaeota archaeon]